MDHIISFEEEDTMRRLYEASMEGCVDNLKSLIQNDPLILSKISLSPYGETPLHVSALFGHLNFTKQLLSIKPQGPKLAMELDRLKRSPLHLASAEGHTDIVQALIQVNDERMFLATDQDGKIPLHYAAMRGRIEVIKLLIGSQHRSIWEKLNEGGETVLHLCVQYNQLEALKILVDKVGYENNEFLNSKDQNGNTILHLAVMQKQVETVEYLVSLPGVKMGATTLNQSGFTAFDLAEHLPKDLKSLRIQNAFQDVGFEREKQQYNHLQQPAASSTKKATTSQRTKFLRFLYNYDQDWLKDKTGAIIIVATVIATITYQTAVNPPGGVWQESRDGTVEAGTAVLAHNQSLRRSEFRKFLIYDFNAFILSLTIIILLISGFPVRYRLCMWILNIFICGALVCLTLTFKEGANLILPLTFMYDAGGHTEIAFYIWFFFLGVMTLIQAIRILIWVLKRIFGERVVKRWVHMFRPMWMAKRTCGNHDSNNSTTLV